MYLLTKIYNTYKLLAFDFFDFLFPPVCVICNKVGYKICPECKQSLLNKQQKHECHVCKKLCFDIMHKDCKHFSHLDGLFVGYKYSKAIELIVQDLKYHGHTQTANTIATLIKESEQGKIFVDIVKNNIPNALFVPVPLHKRKLNSRGFNQAKLIVDELRNQILAPFDTQKDLPITDLIIRTKNTKTQVGMNKLERIKNLQDVFDLTSNQKVWHFVIQIENPTFILVDDIYTTGTTIEECSKVIKKHFKNSKVYGLVLARG